MNRGYIVTRGATMDGEEYTDPKGRNFWGMFESAVDVCQLANKEDDKEDALPFGIVEVFFSI